MYLFDSPFLVHPYINSFISSSNYLSLTTFHSSILFTVLFNCSQSNGDINRCVALLKDDGWCSPQLANNLPPERSVQLQQSNRPTPTTAQQVGTSVRPTDHTPHHQGSATLPRTNLPSTSPVLVPRRDHFVPEYPMELNHNTEFLSSHKTGPSPLKVSPPPFPKEGPTGFQPVPPNFFGPHVSTPFQHPNHSPPGNHHHSSSNIPASMPAQPPSSGSKQFSMPYGHQYGSGALSSSFDQPNVSTSCKFVCTYHSDLG